MPKSFLNHTIGKLLLIALVGFNAWFFMFQYNAPNETNGFSLFADSAILLIQLAYFVSFSFLSFWLFKLLRIRKISEAKGKLATALFVLLLPSLFFQANSFIPILIYLLLITSWYSFLKIYNQYRIWSECFTISLLIGLMTILKLELVLFLPIFWIGIYSIRAFEWRNIAFSILGLLLPWIYTLSYSYLTDQSSTYFLDQNIIHKTLSFDSNFFVIQLIIIFAIFLELFRFKTIGVHQQKQLRYFMIALIYLFILGLLIDNLYFILAFPLSIILIESNHDRSERQWIHEAVLLLILSTNIVYFLMF